VDWWLEKKVKARSPSSARCYLVIDFTEEKYGGGGRI